MKKIGDSTSTANANGEWTEGNPAAGVPATLIKADWLNTIQRELIAMISGAGIALNPGDDAQVLKAVRALATEVLELNIQSSPLDNEAGKILTVGAFGLGSAGGGPAVALNSAFVPGFYRYSSTDPASPTPGSGGSFIVVTAGGNFVQQIAITAVGSTSNPYIGLRSFDGGGTPGPFVTICHGGNLGNASETVAGLVKIATDLKVDSGVDDSLAISPLKLKNKTQSSATDTTPGKLLTVGAFGLGVSGGGPIVALNSAFTAGFYRYSASDPGKPPGTAGAGGSVWVGSGGSNFVNNFVITVPDTTANPYVGVRCFDGGGTPGPWVSIYHSGNLGSATEAVAGLGRIATDLQIAAGVDDAAAITSLKLKNKTQASAIDTTPGKLLTPGAFGWGASAGGPGVSLATAFTSGTYTYSASDTAAPGGAGSGGSVLISSAGGNFIQQLAITTPATTSNPSLALRTFNGSGGPGPWVFMYHTGNIGTVDPWLMQPIGALVAIRDDLSGVMAPSTTASYRYVVLSASSSYNSGALTSESVSGTAPLVIATAVISLAGSPLNGRTINLINTERRVLRAGSSGATEQDALQSHFHTEFVGSSNAASSTTDTTTSYASGLSAAGAYSQRLASRGGTNNVAIGYPITDPDGGTVRGSSETRVKSLGVTYYMRIK